MHQLTNILYHLTSALLIPVILALFLLLAWTLFEVGGFLREWLERRKMERGWQAFLQRLGRKDLEAHEARTLFFQGAGGPGLISVFAQRGRAGPENAQELERILSEIEIEASERCSRMNLWIRIGPMLGLMGTLIPMGPALVGLSAANIEVMAGNLIVAFSTTVIGLLIGALCALMSVTRRHWYVRDLSNMEYMVSQFNSRVDDGWKRNVISGAAPNLVPDC